MQGDAARIIAEQPDGEKNGEFELANGARSHKAYV
jgi:hypothetical protein